VARFVEQFAAAWARPTVERLAALLHPEVRLRAPLMNPTDGYAASREEMRRLLLLWPDVHIEVERWSASGDVVFIEITMHATVAGRPARIPAIDRILLRDGLVLERVTYVAEPLPLLMTLLLRPSAWRRWWRSGLGAPRRPCRLPEIPDGGNAA
jgi:ketosteroid isomerase-like protein